MIVTAIELKRSLYKFECKCGLEFYLDTHDDKDRLDKNMLMPSGMILATCPRCNRDCCADYTNPIRMSEADYQKMKAVNEVNTATILEGQHVYKED